MDNTKTAEEIPDFDKIAKAKQERLLTPPPMENKTEKIKNIYGIENIERSFPGITKEIDDLIERANNGFVQGYTCACANLVRLSGDPDGTRETELLKQSTCTLSELKKYKVDEYDLDVLAPTIKEIERIRNLNHGK